MKIAILGAGALGSVIGGFMARAGLDVTLLDVNDAHINAVNSSGLKLDVGDETTVIPLAAARPDAAPPDISLVILLTKTIHTEQALDGIAPLIDRGVRVMTLQNGLGNADRVAARVPPDNVLYGTTMIPGLFRGPGHVASQGLIWTSFKPYNDKDAAFAKDIENSLKPVQFKLDPQTDAKIWQKVAFNCAMNSTCGLIGGRVQFVAESPEAVELTKTIADEVVEVASALGINVARETVHDHLMVGFREHGHHKPSMLQDLEAGRETEIESLCGEVVRQARTVGVPVPLNAALATLVRAKQAAVRSLDSQPVSD